MYFYKFLDNFEYNNLKINYPKYTSIVSEIKSLQTEINKKIDSEKNPDIVYVMTIYINILRKLRKIDPRPNELFDENGTSTGKNNVKLDNMFIKDLNNQKLKEMK